MKVAGVGGLRDVGAEAVRLQPRVAPARDLGDDAGVPRAARGGDRAGDVVREHAGQRDPPPPQPAAHAAGWSPTSRSSAGKAEAPAMTLNRMYHCVPRIISGLSQMSGFEPEGDDAETASGNSRLAGNAARNCATGCTMLRDARPQADPDADRHPDQAGQRDQHDHAQHGEAAEHRQPCAPRPAPTPPSTKRADPPQRDSAAASHDRRTRRDRPSARRAWARAARRSCRRAGRADRCSATRHRAEPSAAATSARAAQHGQHPGARRRDARPPARSGTGRPRRPAAGTAAGRRSG